MVTVSDTGIGVPAAEMPRLFERFHRIETARARSTEGSGIGLALVKELVGLHGGTITADSREGAGSTFTVRLPFGAAHLPADELAPAPGTRAISERDRRAVRAGSPALAADRHRFRTVRHEHHGDDERRRPGREQRRAGHAC